MTVQAATNRTHKVAIMNAVHDLPVLVARDELTGWLAQLDRAGREGERAEDQRERQKRFRRHDEG